MDRESQSLAINYVVLVVLLCVLWFLITHVSIVVVVDIVVQVTQVYTGRESCLRNSSRPSRGTKASALKFKGCRRHSSPVFSMSPATQFVSTCILLNLVLHSYTNTFTRVQVCPIGSEPLVLCVIELRIVH